MKNLSTYIEQLDFDYVISYSGLRGDFENGIDLFKARIIEEDGVLHSSARAVHKFRKDDQELRDILEVLSISFEEQYDWMCGPVFRDALVFYTKSNEIKNILHLCFSCDKIRSKDDEEFLADKKIFPRLRTIFLKIGHEIKER